MELTDSLTVAELISSQEPFTVAACPPARHKPPIRTRPSQCKCGACERCLDNARWDRIFREKFEDPDYYRQERRQGGSSLA